MDKLLEILEDLVPGVDFESNKNLVESGVLNSLTILNLIGEISDEFNVNVSVKDIIPDNFKSVESIWALIEKLQ